MKDMSGLPKCGCISFQTLDLEPFPLRMSRSIFWNPGPSWNDRHAVQVALLDRSGTASTCSMGPNE